MPTSFRQIRQFLAPRWLTDGEGGLVGYALDLIKDAFVERARLGLLVRFPQQGPDGSTAPSDALSAMGRDRRVVRGINEADSSFASRLLAWLDDRKTAGNPYALMQKLAEYTGAGPSFRTVDNHGNWYSRAADGTRSALINQANWNWDGDTSQWARFWVIVYPNGLWTNESAWAVGAWGDGGAWGTTETVDEVVTMRAIVNDWKPAGTTCINIILALDPASFNPATPEPDGLWANYGKQVASVEVASRLGTARYEAGK